MTPERWEQHKRFVGFDEHDVELLVRHDKTARGYVEGLVEALYEHLLSFRESRQMLASQSVLGVLKRLQQRFFLDLTAGDYGPSYLEQRLRVARTHIHIGLPLHLYLNTYSVYLQLVVPRVLGSEPKLALAQETLQALMKLIMLDQQVVAECYLASAGQASPSAPADLPGA